MTDTPDTILENVQKEMSAGAPTWIAPLARRTGIPLLDVSSTAFSTRAATLGMSKGRGFVHHELRVRPPMPDGLEPEIAVWDGGTIPIWDGGVLTEPKYFSFFQDGPLPVYNPNYRGKWRPHELLHGAIGFFWQPEITRFAFYVGARAAEILPVVHWYHFDEVFRPRCREHIAGGAQRDHCVACEQARVHYWEHQPRPEELDTAITTIASGLAHLKGEISACRQEVDLGHVVKWPTAGLDSSRDAQGYLRGHWNRCTAWSFGAWVELFLRKNDDYYTAVDDLLDRVEQVAQLLLSPAAHTSTDTFDGLFLRRTVQDLGYRTLIELERLGEGHPAEAALWPLLEAAGKACVEDLDVCALQNAYAQLLHTAAQCNLDQVASQGLAGARTTDAARKQVREGLNSVFEDECTDVDAFIKDDIFGRPGRLATRYASFRQDESLRFQAWLRDDPQTDQEGELFGAIPEAPEDIRRGRMRLSKTFRRGTFPASVMDMELTGNVDVVALIWGGQARLLQPTEMQQVALTWIEEGCNGPPSDANTVLELITVGAVIWFPPVRAS